MIEVVGLGLSVTALSLSMATAWLTLARHGHLRMTRPTLCYLGPDGRDPRAGYWPKVYVRALLHSTGKRGLVVENMFATVRHGSERQVFNVWVYGEGDALHRGSGLFVDQDGITLNHHFLLPAPGTGLPFASGDYAIEIRATLTRSKSPVLLETVSVHLPAALAEVAETGARGVFFDWAPDVGEYHPHTGPMPTT